MRSLIFLLVTCGLVTCLAIAVAQQLQQPPSSAAAPELAQDEPLQTYRIRMRCYEREGFLTRTVSEPDMVAIVNRPCSFTVSTGISSANPPFDYVIFGAEVLIEELEGDQVQATLRFSRGKQTKCDDPDTLEVRSSSVEIRTKLTRSEKTTIQLHADT